VRKINVDVNWYKTTHLIFPAQIKYFSSVDNFIVADKRENTPNLLSVKANEEKFEGRANLSVATGDGRFYTFSIGYVQPLIHTNLYLINDSVVQPEHIYINSRNDVHLIFPSPVAYIDFGSDVIEASLAENLQNVVRISTKENFQHETNVSVATNDNKFYTFDLNYKEDHTEFTYIIGATDDKNLALLSKEDLTDDDKEEIVRLIEGKGRTIYTFGIRKNKVEFSIHNIFVRNNKLIFRIELKNNSNIKYDIDYIKFYIVDKKRNKRTASQEIESLPLFIDNFSNLIEGKGGSVFSVCFEKFTIPDGKHFVIEINEKNGGRHILYKLDNKDIIDAEAL